MKAISSIIATLLMLVITIALAGFAYSYISGTFTAKTAEIISVVDSFGDTVTVSNSGTGPISNLKVTLDGTSSNNYIIYMQEPSLVGHWRMDEGSGTIAGDSSGNGNTGTLTNGPTWAPGKYGNAVNFDGTNDYISVPDATSLKPSTITVAFWTKLNSQAAFGVPVMKTTTSSWNDGYGFHNRGGSNEFTWWTNNYQGTNRFVTAPIFSLGTWHHVAGTFDTSSGAKLYIDGVQAGTTATNTTALTNSNSALGIGFATGGNYWNGLIDEVRIYHRALTGQEIKAIYDVGSQIKPGEIATIKIYEILSKGRHIMKLCTASACNTAILTIT